MDKTANELPSDESNKIRSAVNEKEDISKEKGNEYSVSSERNVDSAVGNAEEDQRDSGSLAVDEQQVRTDILFNECTY